VSERHTRWLFVVLLLGQLLLLTAQVRGPGGRGSVLEAGAMRSLAPLASLVNFAGDSVRNLGANVRLNRSLIEENARLRSRLEDLQRENMRLFGAQADMQRLAAALGYQRAAGLPLRAADIVYIDHTSWLQTAIVVVAEGAVTSNQPVVATSGLVGRVVLTTGAYAKIQLITDRAASVGAMIERTRRQGVLRGSGEGSLELDYIPAQAEVRVGDLVVTAGIDGIYPRGVPVGTVAAVAAGAELFHSIRVVPLVDFGVLDQVFIVDREPIPEEMKEEVAGASP
jgi:rod shape-determining protein MreC